LPVTEEPTEGTPGDVPEFDPVLQETITDFLSNLPQGWGIVRPDGLAAELAEDPPILIDVRSQDEWDSVGYIRGAEHIWINDFVASMDQWPEDKDANIVVYCASSYRGNIAYVIMNLMGYTNVRNMAGGINGWLSAGLPVEGGTDEAAPAEAVEFDLQTTLDDYVSNLPGNFNALRVSDLEAKFANEEEFTLVDVRTTDEFAEGFIEGAIHIPLQELTENLDLLPDTSADIVIYCGSGHRSTLALVALNLLGYENATGLLGGTRAWSSADLPLSEDFVEPEVGTAPDFDTALFEAVDAFVKGIPQGYWVTRADALQTQLIENPPVLVDVRTPGEYENGFIPTAVNIPLDELVARFDEWPEDTSTPIVFYGSTSHRGAMALALAQMLGYENASSVGGGTGSWTSNGLDLTQ
jgi:rhodanese-related sulfurtransferase